MRETHQKRRLLKLGFPVVLRKARNIHIRIRFVRSQTAKFEVKVFDLVLYFVFGLAVIWLRNQYSIILRATPY